MIKHLKPREFSGNLQPLVDIVINKEKCIKAQKWQEACLWRRREVNYMKKHFNINIMTERDYVLECLPIPSVISKAIF